MSGRGRHLVVDMVLTELPSECAVQDLLHRCVSAAQMHIIAGPFVQRTGNGIVGVAVLAESHTSLHVEEDGETWAAFWDLFSCREFDADLLEGLVEDALRPAHVTRRTLLIRNL